MELLGLGLLLVMVLAIILLFTRGIFNRDLTRALQRVTQQEQALQEKADLLEQRLSQMEQEYHAKLKRADVEAQRVLQDAKNQAMNIRTAAIEEAKHRARQLLLEVEQGRTQLRDEVAKELHGTVIQRTCEVLRSLLPEPDLSALHTALVRELVDAVQRLDVGTMQQGLERVDVVTAQPLSPEASKALARWVAASFGPEMPVHVETNAALVAGGFVKVGSTTVDNSLANRLGQ